MDKCQQGDRSCIHVEGLFLGLMAIGCQIRPQVHREVSQAPAASVLDLIRLWLVELVNHRLYDCSPAQQHLVQERHQAVFYIFLQLGDHLNVLLKEFGEKCRGRPFAEGYASCGNRRPLLTGVVFATLEGGRKCTVERDPNLLRTSWWSQISRGDPDSPLRWTCKSV